MALPVNVTLTSTWCRSRSAPVQIGGKNRRSCRDSRRPQLCCVAPTGKRSPVLGCVRSDPPVATKLMLPTKRAKRVMVRLGKAACEEPRSSPATASHASVRLIESLGINLLPQCRHARRCCGECTAARALYNFLCMSQGVSRSQHPYVNRDRTHKSIPPRKPIRDAGRGDHRERRHRQRQPHALAPACGSEAFQGAHARQADTHGPASTFESIGKPLPGRRNLVLTRAADRSDAGHRNGARDRSRRSRSCRMRPSSW